MQPDTDADRHDIELRDVADADDPRCPDALGGCLVVSYNAVERLNATYTQGRHVSARLSMACMALFDDGGTIDVADLTAEERAWIEAESAAHSNAIDFAGVDA